MPLFLDSFDPQPRGLMPEAGLRDGDLIVTWEEAPRHYTVKRHPGVPQLCVVERQMAVMLAVMAVGR